METWVKILIIVGSIVVGLGIIFSIFCLFFISYRIYRGVLIRVNKEKWTRTCSAPEDPTMVEMWDKGLVWGEENKQYMKVVRIQNEGLNLVGEFFDFGYDKSVIIVAGRTECCKYSYFYAMPYKDAGYNVLVFDTRAHGWSDGKYNTAGIKESGDLLAWMKYLHDELNQNHIITHSICVGGSACMIAATREDTPSYYEKCIFDGLFISFVESFATHMKEQGHGKSPIFYMVWFWFRVKSGVSVKLARPIKYIEKLNKPVLFLHGKEDIFSLPEKSSKMFGMCKSDKTVVWFEHGAHSRLRLVNPDEYDAAIKRFIK